MFKITLVCMKINEQHDKLTHSYFVFPVPDPRFLPRLHRHAVAAERLSRGETALAHVLLPTHVGSARALWHAPLVPNPRAEGPAASAPSTLHPARSIDPSYASGPSYKVRLGFRALLTPLRYHVSVLPAFSFIVIPRPCSNLLFSLTSTAVNPNPGCLWLLKPPPTHDCPLQFIFGGRKVKRHPYFQTRPMQSLCKCILEHMSGFLLMSVSRHKPCTPILSCSYWLYYSSFLQDQVSSM